MHNRYSSIGNGHLYHQLQLGRKQATLCRKKRRKTGQELVNMGYMGKKETKTASSGACLIC